MPDDIVTDVILPETVPTDAPPDAESARASIDESVRAIETAIQRGVDRVLEAFDNKIAYDASKQQQIDVLHHEVQQYRGGLIARTARPLVQGVIRFHDDIGKLTTALRSKPADEVTPERCFAILDGLQEDLEILLNQNGVASYRESQDALDLRRQRVVRKVTTDNPELAGKVAERIRPGFETGNEILEKERVAAYEVRKPSPETATPAPAAAPQAVATDREA